MLILAPVRLLRPGRIWPSPTLIKKKYIFKSFKRLAMPAGKLPAAFILLFPALATLRCRH